MTSDYRRRDLISRTYHLRHDQAAAFAQIADELGIGHSHLARYMMDFFLAELRAGRLRLRTEPRAWRLLDFDDEG